LESEKRTLSLLVETSFYQAEISNGVEPQQEEKSVLTSEFAIEDKAKALDTLLSNPDMAQQIMQLLLSNAANA
jgi:hypothetical protein